MPKELAIGQKRKIEPEKRSEESFEFLIKKMSKF